MASETDTTQLSGVDKASLLLVALGSSAAGTVLKHLTPEEAQLLGVQIARHKSIDDTLKSTVVEEFAKSHGAGATTTGVDFAREVLQQALGPTKAEEVLSEVSADSRPRPFGWLRNVPAARLAECLEGERSQVMALILGYLAPARAAEVITLLPQAAQGEVAYRLTCSRDVSAETAQAVESVLQAGLKETRGPRRDASGGLRSLVEILNNADRTTESKILEHLQSVEADVAENVRAMLFAFEDIVKLEDQALQAVIQAVEQEDLRLAIKGSSEEIKEALMRNMSQRAAEAMREDLETMGRVKARDIEAAQRRVVSMIRQLDERGEISINPDADEDEYVQ